jgi:hypothetical protein
MTASRLTFAFNEARLAIRENSVNGNTGSATKTGLYGERDLI